LRNIKCQHTTNAIFHCRIRSDNLLFISQNIRCGSTGKQPAIGTENIAQPLQTILTETTMRKLLTLIITVVVFSSCEKDDETKSIETTPTYFTFNGNIGTNDNSTITSNDNNLIICGNSGASISVLKISKSGDEIWRSDFNAGNMSEANSIVQTTNNDIFICGETYRNYSATRIDILLIKTNSSGDTIWTKTFGGNEADYGKNIISTSDGNLLIAGKTESFGAGSFGDIYLLKLDLNGDTIWTKSYSDLDQEVPFSLIETTDGGYLVTGTNEDNSNPRGLYLLKVNSTGKKVWDKTIGAGQWKCGFSTIELSDGNLLTCGQYTSNGYSQVLVLKTDNQGNTIWEKEYGENNLSEKGNSIKENTDGTFTITGSSYDFNTMQDDIIVLKIDQDGKQNWYKKFGSNHSDWGINLIKDVNEDNIITGDYDGSIFMTKVGNDGKFK